MTVRKLTYLLGLMLLGTPLVGCENRDESRSIEVETEDGPMDIQEGEPNDLNVQPRNLVE